jgi:predicted O-linked N-acetylglucosamine transferase (SPINDLY family)
VKFSREDFKLPENKLIFCAIHNPLKINPKLLSSWANILTKIDNSILWVNGINEVYKENFIKEIEKRKLKKNRIIFADRLNKTSDHLERLKLADIFLDAHPYNAHSTTYDILDARLPMVTMKGDSFASRVASSILSSYGLNELIAINIKNYEDIAIELANNKTKREKIKNKLNDLKSFNHKHFTNNLEELYYKMINKNFNVS